MWWNAKWLNRLMAAEQLLTSLPGETADDMELEPGLLTLSATRGLDETVFEAENDEDEQEEDDANLDLAEEHEEGADD